MRNKTFKTKEEYLQYRKDWKNEYNTLSCEIRECRKDIRNMQRNKEYAGGLQYGLIRLRAEATEMLEELKFAKPEAQRQYLASRAELVAA